MRSSSHWRQYLRCGFLATLISGGESQAQDDEAAPAFVSTRFVAQEHITAPTGISVSPEGVVFVSCDPNGTRNQRQRSGKVVRCEDTDGDGVGDQFSNYVEAIDAPRGSCYVDNILYLVQPPEFVAYEDVDGDGVAERRTVLVTQLGPSLRAAPAHHGPNGVRMGIDGWLYLAMGDRGCQEATGTDGSQATLHGGGILRVRPDGSQLSVLLAGTRNLYDVAVDPYLNLFARDNTNDGGGWSTRLHHLVELADFGYPHLYRQFGHEALASLADYGPGAGTAMLYVHEPGFPKDFGNALYSGDFNTGVAIHRRKPHHESFQVQQAPFMDLPKPTGMDVDGSSRLYVASWLGGGFGQAKRPFGHVELIQPTDRSESAIYPEIDQATDQDLLKHLGSPSQVTRIHAMREMISRGPKSTFSSGLLNTAKDQDRPLYARVAALVTLKQLDGAGSHAVLEKLYEDREVREFVVRALGDVATEIDSLGRRIFLRALGDENRRVQLRAVVALARLGDVATAPAILPLAIGQTMLSKTSEADAPDPEGWSPPRDALSHIALKAVVGLNATSMLLGKLDDLTLREAALRGLQEMHSKQVVSGLTTKMSSTDDPKLVKLILLALFRLYHREAPWDGKTWWGHRPNFKGPYYQGVTWEETPSVRKAIEAGFLNAAPSDYAVLFKRMRRNQVPEKELEIDVDFDEVLAFLSNERLTPAEHTQVMNAASDRTRPEEELLQIYDYFKNVPLPHGYHYRAQVLRKWNEGRAEGRRQRAAYAEFVSGKEFIGQLKTLRPFFKDDEEASYKYAHLQLLHLIRDPNTPSDTRREAEEEMEKTWADKKNLYPHRLRGLMLAFEEWDPSPYADLLKPLVDHRDERVKQAAARYLKAMETGTPAE